MYRKFRTILISLLLIFVFVMSNIMTTFAVTIIEDYTSGTGGTGNVQSDMYAKQKDENTIVMVVVSRGSGHEYEGHEADRVFANSYGDKQQILDTLQRAGVENPEEALKEKGMYFNEIGSLRDQDGKQVRTIDLRELKPTPTPTPSPDPDENSSTPSHDPDENPPTPSPDPDENSSTPSPDPTPPPHSHNWSYDVVGSVWRLDSLKVNSINEYYDGERVLGTTNPRVSKQINKKLYERNSSLSRAYNDSKISININEVHPDCVNADLTYTATWIKIEKYYEECSCGASYGPYYRRADSKTQNINLNYSADIYNTEYYSYLPIDLTTQDGYNYKDKGELQINKVHKLNIKQEDGRLDEKIPITVTKHGFKAGERLQLSSTNKPGKFTIDFGNTWFGLPESLNLTGKKDYVQEGYQNVAWAELWYGADYLQDTRNQKINTITKFNDPNTETWSSENIYINNPNIKIGKRTFSLRSIKPSGDPNTPYYLGESKNNCWVVYFELNRSNLKGIDWNVRCNDDSNSLEISIFRENYTPYVIYNTYMQPILYGEYDVLTVGGK